MGVMLRVSARHEQGVKMKRSLKKLAGWVIGLVLLGVMVHNIPGVFQLLLIGGTVIFLARMMTKK